MNEEKSIAQQITARLEEARVTPTPRWQVLSQKALEWGVAVGLIVVAGIALSLVMLRVLQLAGDPAHPLRIVWALPLVWVGLALLAGWLSLVALRHTPHGYRFRASFLTVCGVLGVSAVAFFLHIAHINETTERFLGERGINPEGLHEKQWYNPAEGRLAGRVEEVAPQNIILRDRQGRQWVVEVMPTTQIFGMWPPIIRTQVFVQGQVRVENYFSAQQIKVLPDPHDRDHDRDNRNGSTQRPPANFSSEPRSNE